MKTIAIAEQSFVNEHTKRQSEGRCQFNELF